MKPMGARETVAVGLLCHAVCGPRGSLGVGRAFLGVSVWRVSLVMCKLEVNKFSKHFRSMTMCVVRVRPGGAGTLQGWGYIRVLPARGYRH